MEQLKQRANSQLTMAIIEKSDAAGFAGAARQAKLVRLGATVVAFSPIKCTLVLATSTALLLRVVGF